MPCRGRPAWPNYPTVDKHPRFDSSILRPLVAQWIRIGHAEFEILVVAHLHLRIERQFGWERLLRKDDLHTSQLNGFEERRGMGELHPHHLSPAAKWALTTSGFNSVPMPGFPGTWMKPPLM
ncbi:hypothetical protein SBA4_1670002 [Candidatus Sulfopaludibacter sp. SbA4]|nr:hypothetical protein SBA4_1670002 [Candidatus Sulfopaludibacter sp. SbA4]